MKYHFRITRSGGGYVARCLELKGCQTQAANRRELVLNMKEALDLYLDEPPNSRLQLPFPKRISGKRIEKVEVDPQIAFAFYLRQLRLREGLTQKEAAKLLGFKNIFSYQRLESSKTANPELMTLLRLKKAFKEFDLDEILAA